MARNGFAVNPLGLFTEEFDEGRAIGDFTLGLGQRLALLGGQDGAQIVLVLHHQVEPFAQDTGAFLAGHRSPFLLCGIGGIDGLGDLLTAQVGDLRNDIPARRIVHVERAIGAIDPLAADISLGHQQVGVFQEGFEISGRVEHESLHQTIITREAEASAA